jgi:HEAT repeat protein
MFEFVKLMSAKSTLKASDVSAQLRAVSALTKLNDPRASDVLLTALDSEFQSVFIAAAEALANLRELRAVPLLLGRLTKNWNPDVARLLGKLGDPRAIDPLVKQLMIPPWSTDKKEAAVALEVLGWKPTTAQHRTALAISLGRFRDALKEGAVGTDALFALLDWKIKSDSETDLAEAKAVVATLGPIVHENPEVLKPRLDEIRLSQLRRRSELWEVSENDARALEALGCQPKTPEDRVAIAIAGGLYADAAKQGAASVKPLLAALLNDPYYGVWSSSETEHNGKIRQAIGQIQGDQALEIMINELSNAELEDVASDYDMGIENKSAYQVEHAMILHSRILFERLCLSESLGNNKARGAVGALSNSIRDDLGLKFAFAASLEDKENHESRIRANTNLVIDVQLATVTALGQIGGPDAVEPVIKALGMKWERVVTNAIQVLGDLGDARALPFLVDAGTRSNRTFADYTARAITNIKRATSVKP